jgi:hypothetical protein
LFVDVLIYFIYYFHIILLVLSNTSSYILNIQHTNFTNFSICKSLIYSTPSSPPPPLPLSLESSKISITGCFFNSFHTRNNVSGGILSLSHTSKHCPVFIFNTTFNNISVLGLGGVIHFGGGGGGLNDLSFEEKINKIIINSSSFTECVSLSKSGGGGGALAVSNHNYNIQMTNLNFISCSSPYGRGGACYVSVGIGGTFLFENVSFLFCMAESFFSNDVYILYVDDIDNDDSNGFILHFTNVCTDSIKNGANSFDSSLDDFYSSNCHLESSCDLLSNDHHVNYYNYLSHLLSPSFFLPDLCESRKGCSFDKSQAKCIKKNDSNNKSIKVYQNYNPQLSDGCNDINWCYTEDGRCGAYTSDYCQKLDYDSCLGVCVWDEKRKCDINKCWNNKIVCGFDKENNCVKENFPNNNITNPDIKEEKALEIILEIFIPTGVIILSITIVIMVLIIRYYCKNKEEEKNKYHQASINSKLINDDGDIDVFYLNKEDFVS